jgi:hypothetical protein
MSTNSLIVPPGSTTGRYVHWDGYPEHMLEALTAIVQRDGLDKAVQVLTEDHFGWSIIDHDGRQGDPYPNDDRFEAVPGYGIAYTQAGQVEPWLSVTDFWGYAYRLTANGAYLVKSE